MNPLIGEIADQLLLIERALRLQGLWSDQEMPETAVYSTEPFALDCLQLEEWLQWIFLPRMKTILEMNHPLPASSGIREMAEMVYAEKLQEVATLLEALEQFDQLILNQNTTQLN